MLSACRLLLCQLCLGLVLGLSGLAAQALSVQVSGGSPAAVEALQAELRASLPELQWRSSQERSGAPDLWIALSPEAYQALKNPAQPVLVLAAEPAKLSLRRQDSALYWAPPLRQQLQLARLLFPGAQRIGILNSGDTPALLRLREQAAREGVELILREGDSSRLARQVAELAHESSDLCTADEPGCGRSPASASDFDGHRRAYHRQRR